MLIIAGRPCCRKSTAAPQLNFAEVAFANGHVQVVDFQDRPRGAGLYQLLDFADGRHVKTVRIVARSRPPQTTIKIYMRK